MGDPAGIGPDIALLSWRRGERRDRPVFFVVGDAAVFAEQSRCFAARDRIKLSASSGRKTLKPFFSGALPSPAARPALGPVIAGSPASHAAAIVASIEMAAALTFAGRASAVVTAPIAKHVLLEQGLCACGPHRVPGRACRAGMASLGVFPVMLMASPRLMAVPVTVHIALEGRPRRINAGPARRARPRLPTPVSSAYFGIENPRLAICGLNPHAGEEGELGREEIEIIAPAVAR